MTSDLFDLIDDSPPIRTEKEESFSHAQSHNQDMLTKIMQSMNPQQSEAVLAPNGPILILAGAGTGKTRVLTTRIAHKIATQQAWASQFLVVTFTNKASLEMKQRIIELLNDTKQEEVIKQIPWLGTFHSVSAKILRRHATLIGLKSDFTIFDTDDQIRLLKQLIQEKNIDEKNWPAKQLAAYIDHWKNRAWQPHQVPKDESYLFCKGAGKEIYQQYQKRLIVLNATDFGGLILNCLCLFQDNQEILEEYQNRFRHILVDEYQDTNTAQYLWLKLLAQKHKNICCVGDDDQSIYGWRGAEITNILRFEDSFSGAKIIKLEQNYRSTSHILEVASGLISFNKKRLSKSLWTESQTDEKVQLRSFWDGTEEARIIVDTIETAQGKDHKLSEMAILVRASFQMREFEDILINRGIPYRVIGGPRFYERAEIRDINAYLRLIAQPSDDLAFERIFNKPRRGLGKIILQTLHKTARHKNISLFHAAHHLLQTDTLKSATENALTTFINLLNHWCQLKDTIPHQKLIQSVLDESGYMHMWKIDKSPNASSKIENLKELIHSTEEFESLNAYLEHISLVMDSEITHTNENVFLMTLHAAKGLEFDTVFLPGWEEGVFPHQRRLNETGTQGLEEERRLAYVGITRAKKHLTISFVGSRRIYGRWKSVIPSRFIDELTTKNIQIIENQYTHTLSSRTQSTLQNLSSTPSSFQKGERIFHQKFGYGRIDDIDNNKLTITFEKAGKKKVLDHYVEKH